jgi:hypothetical protein
LLIKSWSYLKNWITINGSWEQRLYQVSFSIWGSKINK